VVFGRAVDLDRDVHQAEGDRTFPYGTHKARLAGMGMLGGVRSHVNVGYRKGGCGR
jgi:hypothetical protein